MEAARMLALGRRDVEALLDLPALIDALADAMADVSAGRASVPNRVAASVPGRDGLLAAMPAHVSSTGALAAKLVSLFPHNADSPLPTHQAVIVVFDAETGEPAALLDGTYVTAMRTAAGSALSTRLLAREAASVLAIIGSGVQARSHARALPIVRDFTEIRVAARDVGRAERLAAELSEAGLPASASRSYADAIAGADVVCATTHSIEPVVRREWLTPGVHVTSVGYNPGGRELDDETVTDAYVVVESRAAALAPVPAGANDLTEPIRAGVIDEGHVRAEIGELVLGTQEGRSSDSQITLYKSVGIAAQDAAAAALVVTAARAAGAGQELAL